MQDRYHPDFTEQIAYGYVCVPDFKSLCGSGDMNLMGEGHIGNLFTDGRGILRFFQPLCFVLPFMIDYGFVVLMRKMVYINFVIRRTIIPYVWLRKLCLRAIMRYMLR